MLLTCIYLHNDVNIQVKAQAHKNNKAEGWYM